MQSLQGTKIKNLNTLVDISLHLQTKKWIQDLNLGFTELHYVADNEQICDAIINASMLLMCREYPLLNYQSTTLPSTMLTYSPVNTIHIHHSGHGHFVTSSSSAGKVKIYDSLNLTPTQELLDHIKAVCSVDSSHPEIEQVFIFQQHKMEMLTAIFLE